jgi:NAD(P)-dependent dehydrogenase (short-subunit alcohol dehydrogenase family)
MSLEGQTVLVTGANRGLGAAFVDVAVTRGAARVYASARRPETCAALVERHGSVVVPVELDVASADHIARAARDCADTTLIVNNAGISGLTPASGPVDAALEAQILAVNYGGPRALTAAFGPAMMARGSGGMIFVLSMTALVATALAPVYGASKAAASLFAQCAQAELAAKGVTVTIAYPGFMDTDMAASYPFPKAPPHGVVEQIFDGYAAGQLSVFPDTFAKLTRGALETQMPAILANPHGVLQGLIGAFVSHPEAGR